MANKFLRRAALKSEFKIKGLVTRRVPNRVDPFASPVARKPILHCCYHKVGTVWFSRVLRGIAAEFGLRYGAGATYSQILRFERQQDSDVFLDLGSHVRTAELGDFVGSHMIRDPRDMVVSGYFYHKWTDETWANIPLAEYRGQTYREHLNNISEPEGLAEEIRRMAFWVPHMASWNFNDDRFYEIRYEEIIKDEERVFKGMFEHFGFHSKAVEKCLRVCRKYSFRRMVPAASDGKRSHLRSGKSGEWQHHFHEEHRSLFKSLYPGALEALGYEKDDNW